MLFRIIRVVEMVGVIGKVWYICVVINDNYRVCCLVGIVFVIFR